MSFIVVTVSDWHCCNIDYHKSNTLDRNKLYISKNKVWSGTIFWKPFAVVRRQIPFPDCFLFRTVRLQRPGISLWLIARPKTDICPPIAFYLVGRTTVKVCSSHECIILMDMFLSNKLLAEICQRTFEIVSSEVLSFIRGSYQTLSTPHFSNATRKFGGWTDVMTPSIDQLFHKIFDRITEHDFVTKLDFLPNWGKFPRVQNLFV